MVIKEPAEIRIPKKKPRKTLLLNDAKVSFLLLSEMTKILWSLPISIIIFSVSDFAWPGSTEGLSVAVPRMHNLSPGAM